jgi:hypothetical protein
MQKYIYKCMHVYLHFIKSSKRHTGYPTSYFLFYAYLYSWLLGSRGKATDLIWDAAPKRWATLAQKLCYNIREQEDTFWMKHGYLQAACEQWVSYVVEVWAATTLSLKSESCHADSWSRVASLNDSKKRQIPAGIRTPDRPVRSLVTTPI